jgi:hypothetical protein
VTQVAGSGVQAGGASGHGVRVAAVGSHTLQEAQPRTTLHQHVGRAGGLGEGEATELRPEAHELCAVGQEQMEGVIWHVGALGW